jgi:hypothetical protein
MQGMPSQQNWRWHTIRLPTSSGACHLAPFMISVDKTLQEAAREKERPDAKFFPSVTLPRQILKPEFQNGFGSSRVSAAGIAEQ